MIIKIDGEVYTVPPEEEAKLLQQLCAMGENTYESQGLELQLLADALARWVLAKWETAVRKLHGKDASMVMRLPRKENGRKLEPTRHLSNLLVAQMGEMVKHAELTVTTDGYRNATAFNLSVPTQDQEGRSLVPYGHIGQWENHGAKIP